MKKSNRTLSKYTLAAIEIYERKLTSEQLHATIASLPDKQAKRIYAHYFMGMSKTAIARAESVSEGQSGKVSLVDCKVSKNT